MNEDETPAASIAARQQRVREYFQENERLTRELTDEQARALITWASEYVSSIAADPSRSDAQIDSLLQAVRQAVRHVARTFAHEQDSTRLVLLARQALEQSPPHELP
jgi:hypothetical protein